jgi:tetratricopeptide (TPR) repeat protein
LLLQSAMGDEEFAGPLAGSPVISEAIEDSPPYVSSDANAPTLTREIYDQARDLYLRGVEHSNKGEYREAAELFRQAVAIDPGAWQAYESLGDACYYLFAYDQSIEALLKAIRLNPNPNNTAVTHYYLGLSYVMQMRWEDAKAALQRALSLSNETHWEAKDSDAYYNLAFVLTRLGEAEQRIKELTNGIAAGVERNVDRFELANLYLWVGNHAAAKKQHKILEKTSPKLAEEFRRLRVRHRIY